MRRLRTFLSVSSAERALLLRAVAAVSAVRLSLWLLPFAFVQRGATGVSGHGHRQPGHAYRIDRIVWAVRAVSRCIPAATCLTQAIAGQRLLVAAGYDSRLQIGVANGGSTGFQAHAWLICEGNIVLGGGESDRFAPLASWDVHHSDTEHPQAKQESRA